MDRRFEARKQEILDEAEIKLEVANGMLKRLEQFAEPFVDSLGRREAKQNARVYISGLLSDLERKNVESIAHQSTAATRANPSAHTPAEAASSTSTATSSLTPAIGPTRSPLPRSTSTRPSTTNGTPPTPE